MDRTDKNELLAKISKDWKNLILDNSWTILDTTLDRLSACRRRCPRGDRPDPWVMATMAWRPVFGKLCSMPSKTVFIPSKVVYGRRRRRPCGTRGDVKHKPKAKRLKTMHCVGGLDFFRDPGASKTRRFTHPWSIKLKGGGGGVRGCDM